MRVGLLHLGQSVDFVVSISFLRSPVFAILAIGGMFLLLRLSLHTPAQAGGFNGAVLSSLVRRPAAQPKVRRQRNCHRRNAVKTNRTRSLQFTILPHS
jgi:hypothetical protein